MAAPRRPACVGLLVLARAASGKYTLGESFLSKQFFANWTFDGRSPTDGAVEYLDHSSADLWGLINATSDRVYVGADTQTVSSVRSRRSVRIKSNAHFNEGLFVLQVDHVPSGCGTWPSFGLHGEGEGRRWPSFGEIGVIDGVHRTVYTTTSLRTSAGCSQAAVEQGRDFSTKWSPGETKVADNCYIKASGQHENQGCAQSGPKRSMGSSFNAGGGGTYALEWDPVAGFIRTWFWPNGTEPWGQSVPMKPEPADWGLPYSFFRISEQDCPASHFQNMSLVFDINFCGSKGVDTFKLDCPEVASMTCEELVAKHPEQMQQAFWSIRSLNVYHRSGGSSASTPDGSSSSGAPASASAARASAAEARAAALAEAAPGNGSEEPRNRSGELKDAFHVVRRTGKALPSRAFGNHSAPLPTNAWWQNAALAEDPSSLEANVFQLPYVITMGSSAVNTMQPYPVQDTTEYFAQSFNQFEAVSLGASQQLTGPVIASWDQLTVAFAWHNASGGVGMVAPLARGSPYITMEYNGTTPLVSSEQKLRSSGRGSDILVIVDGKASPCDAQVPLQGKVFEVTMEQSDATWLVFSPSDVEWVCTASPFSLAAASPLRGAVRLALASSCASGAREGLFCSEGADVHAYPQLLKDHAGSYPVNASISYQVRSDTGSVVWRWEGRTLSGWEPAELLSLAWPLHLERLSSEGLVYNVAAATPFHDVRGRPVAVVGSKWQMDYELFPDVGLGAPRPIAQEMRDDIREALIGDGGALWNGSSADSEFDLPSSYQLGAGDTYFAGKMISRLARLVAIASELGEERESYFTDLLERLQSRLEGWLAPGGQAPFLYDASWGGIVSCGCGAAYECSSIQPDECQGLHDMDLNFGNGFYSDHHFQYGYLIYAVAVLARHRPEWEEQWRPAIEALILDFGNPRAADEKFPLVRHMDWFLGLSWSSGVTGARFRGRSQDAASEAVNAYYALYAYGSVVNSSLGCELRDFGRLLAAMEAHAARTYRFVRATSSVYGDYFAEGAVGTLWEHAASRQSRFGARAVGFSAGAASAEALGGALLPFTPITESILSEEWVAEHLDSYVAACGADSECEALGWSWAVCLAQAVADPAGSHRCVKELPPDVFGSHVATTNGNSLTNSLYWIATRPKPYVDEQQSQEVLMKFENTGRDTRRINYISPLILCVAGLMVVACVAALARSRRAAPPTVDTVRRLCPQDYERMWQADAEGGAAGAAASPGRLRLRQSARECSPVHAADCA